MIRCSLIIFFLFVRCFTSKICAQNSASQIDKTIDSLCRVYKTVKADSGKVNALNALTQIYWNIDLDTALLYGNQSLLLARKSKFKSGEAQAYNNLAGTHFFRGDFDKALTSNLRALTVKQQLLPNGKTVASAKSIASTLNNIGTLYLDMGKYEKAIHYQLRSLEIKEKLNDSLGIAKAVNNIGNIYDKQGNEKLAAQYYRRSLKLMEQLNNKGGISAALNNLGNMFLKQNQFAIALDYFNKALSIRRETEDLKGIGATLNNIGETYYEMRDYKRAVKYYNEALLILEKTGEIYGRAVALNNIGDIYTVNKDYRKALEYYVKSLSVSKESGIAELEQTTYKSISKTYALLGEYKQAYEYRDLYSNMHDSLFKKESTKQIAEMQAKYESEKYQRVNEVLTKENEISELALHKSRLSRNSLIVGCILILILGFVLLNRYHLNRKINLKLGEQNKIIAEKNKDIIDSINYSKRIQDALLPGSDGFKKELQDSFILFQPKDVLSGDFYWYDKIDERFLFAVADCTGHGVPGALMSIVGHNFLNLAIKEHKLWNPSEILNELNQEVTAALNKKTASGTMWDGMDIALCSFDKQTLQLQYAGANNPLWIIRRKEHALTEIESSIFQQSSSAVNVSTETAVKHTGKLAHTLEFLEIKADKYPIGSIYGDKLRPFTPQNIQLQKGDALYVFSDGYADQFGGDKGKKFKYSQLKELLLTINNEDMATQKDILHITFEKWKGKLEQVDDVCIIGVRI